MLPLKPVLEIIAGNTVKHGIPIPTPKDVCYSWAEGLKLPAKGKYILYTGCLYQILPYINALTHMLEKLENLKGSNLVLNVVKKFSNISKLMNIFVRPSASDIRRYSGVVRKIALLLRNIGVDVGYLYSDDLYSGALLYDLGLDDAFKAHAYRVYSRLKEHGVEKIVTIDPHTTHMLRAVYREYIDDYSIEVINYLELLSKANVKFASLKSKFTIHDPCLYARYENIIEEPRELLHRAGVEVVEPVRTKSLSFCCGGPIESLTPRMANRIAKHRLEELANAHRNVIVMCPICYANLDRANMLKNVKIVDIADVLYKALLQTS